MLSKDEEWLVGFLKEAVDQAVSGWLDLQDTLSRGDDGKVKDQARFAAVESLKARAKGVLLVDGQPV